MGPRSRERGADKGVFNELRDRLASMGPRAR